MGKNNAKTASLMRKKEYYQNLAPLNVEDLNMFPKASLHPIIFEEISIKEKGGESEEASTETSIAQKVATSTGKKSFHNSNKTHIIVMVHGF